MAGEAITNAGFAFLRDADNRGLTHDQMLAAFEAASRDAESPLVVSDLTELIPPAEIPQLSLVTKMDTQAEETMPPMPVPSQPKSFVPDASSFELKYEDGGGVKIEMRGPASVVGDFDWSSIIGSDRRGEVYEPEIPTYEPYKPTYETHKVESEPAPTPSSLSPVPISPKAQRMPVVVETGGFTLKTVGKNVDRSQKDKYSRNSGAKNNRVDATTHRGRRIVAIGLATAAVVGGGVYGVLRSRSSSEQTQGTPIPIGSIAYADSGTLVAYYTKEVDKTVVTLPEAQTGGPLPITDSGTMEISVVQNMGSKAFTQSGNEIQVDRSAYSLVTSLGATPTAKPCVAEAVAGTDSTCVNLVKGDIAADKTAELSAEEAKRVTTILSLSADGKVFNKTTVTAALIKLTSAGLKTSEFATCLAPFGSLADAAIRSTLQKDGKQVVFRGNYKSVDEEYAQRADVKPSLDADAVGINGIKTTCKQKQAA